MQAPDATKTRRIISAIGFSVLLTSGFAQSSAPTAPDNSSAPTPAAPVPAAPPPAAGESGSEASPVQLSPFEVNSTQDNGYRARNTLAGSRISTNLEDIASPITVVTKDFLDDIGAVNINQILTYEAGTEGTMDFQANNPQLGRTTDNATQDPNSATRGWGLAPFDITRDYFFSLSLGNPVFSTQGIGQSVGFDTYNLDNVTIARGADSILAGLGSPAGIINYAPQLAMLDKSTTDISYRFGSYQDKRAIFNTNQILTDGKLAIRVAGVWNDYGFEQQPAYDKDKRYYAAFTWQPFSTTTIHASYENVNVNERLPNTFTPEDDISQWLQLGKPSSPAPSVQGTGTNNSYLGGAINGGPNLFYNPNGTVFEAYNNTTGYSFSQQNLSNVPSAFWQPLRFSNDTYGDWHDINTSGTEQSLLLSTQEISVDQQIIPGLSINVSGLHEISNDHQINTVRPDFVADYVDVNQELPNGLANPYYGHTFMYFSGLDNFNQVYSTNLVGRATLTYDLDLKKYNPWFGRYVFTGFTEYRKTQGDFIDFNTQEAGVPAETGGGPGVITYTGGSAANGYVMTSSASTPALVTDAPFLSGTGPLTNTYSTDETLKEEYKAITKLTTSAVVIQAYLLPGDLAVGTFGLRRDVDQQGYLTTPGIDSATGVVDALPFNQFASGPLAKDSAQTKTYGIVLHGPKIGGMDFHWLSVGYSQSENFVPNAGSVDLVGNSVPDPTGKTKDYSVSVDLLDGKLNAKVDWFNSVAAGSPDASVNFPLVQWTIPFEILGSYADLAKQAGVANFQTGLGSSITTGDPALANAYSANTQAEGMELELTYNVTKNWRVFGSVTRTSAEQSNIAPALTSFIAGRVAYWTSIGIMNGPYKTTQDWGGTSTPETGLQVYNNNILGPELGYLAVDGQPSQQLHKWKAAVVTNYTFDQGIAKGFGVGTGIRWLDQTIIGNPPVYSLVNGVETVTGLNLADPYTTPAEATLQGWLSYSTKVYKDKYVLSFRLEGDNLQAKNDGYQAVSANADGTHAVFAIDPPPTFYFTTELKF